MFEVGEALKLGRQQLRGRHGERMQACSMHIHVHGACMRRCHPSMWHSCLVLLHVWHDSVPTTEAGNVLLEAAACCENLEAGTIGSYLQPAKRVPTGCNSWRAPVQLDAPSRKPLEQMRHQLRHQLWAPSGALRASHRYRAQAACAASCTHHLHAARPPYMEVKGKVCMSV